MKYLTAKQYASLPRPKINYLIHKFVPRTGSVMVVGPPKEGKSFLALQIAMAIAKGEPFLGRPSLKSKVLYLNFDNPFEIWNERLNELEQNGIELPENLILPNPHDPDYRNKVDLRKNPDDVIYLQDMVKATEPALVIVDTLRDIYSGNENDSDIASELYKILMDVFPTQCVLYLHHTHKLSPPPGQKVEHRIAPVDAARGANAMAGKMNAVYLLHGNNLRTDPRFDSKADYKAHMDPITKLWIFDEEAKLTKHEAKVREAWASKSWGSWLEFKRHIQHTLVTVPDHLIQRLEDDLQLPSSTSSEQM